MQHYKYPSIDQFRNAVKQIRLMSSYAGKDSDGEPIYKQPLTYPVVEFQGTVKIHGANSSIVYENGEVYAQSRNHVITVDDDSYGFSAFVEQNKAKFIEWFEAFDIKYERYIAYGEWCGGNIQKGVGITGLDKMFVIFDIRAANDEGEAVVKWHTERAELCDVENVYSISKFSEYHIKIDFNNPELSQNILSDWTNKVEEQCPVANYFGVQGIGEGIVWIGSYNNKTIRFKVKGEKHSVTKVKTLAEVDVVKLNSIKEYVEHVVTENRVKQAMSECKATDIKDTGDVIRWIFNDVIKEESDTLEQAGLEKKDIGKDLSMKAKGYFFDLLNKDS